jgi:hypothetical protein
VVSSGATRAQERQLAGLGAEGRQRLVPQQVGVGVRAGIVTRILGAHAQPPLVRDHRVVPRRQAEAERRRFRRAGQRSKACIEVHRTFPPQERRAPVDHRRAR